MVSFAAQAVDRKKLRAVHVESDGGGWHLHPSYPEKLLYMPVSEAETGPATADGYVAAFVVPFGSTLLVARWDGEEGLSFVVGFQRRDGEEKRFKKLSHREAVAVLHAGRLKIGVVLDNGVVVWRDPKFIEGPFNEDSETT